MMSVCKASVTSHSVIKVITHLYHLLLLMLVWPVYFIIIISSLSFNKHVTNVIIIYVHCVTLDTAETMVASVVRSRLDYCNAVLYGVSPSNIDRLQNVLARVVVQAPSTISSMDIRRELHWLPVLVTSLARSPGKHFTLLNHLTFQS